MKNILKKIIYSIFLFSITLSLAHAQTVESVVNDFLGNQYLNNLGAFMEAFSYVAGIAFVFKGALKFKEHNESKGQVKIFIPILFLVAGACFLAIPTLINTGIETFGFDGGGSSSTFKF